MTEILTQDEINQLLTAIDEGEGRNAFESVETFEEYLLKREIIREKPYGIFEKDISVCRFFSSDKNENLLQDINKKNKEQGFGNINIPNTNITLLNYSFCQKCKTIYSYKDLIEYYRNPKPDKIFQNRATQFRNDTRICCKNCDTYFLPSLIISDGTPKNEVQFLCRIQTIDAVEKYFQNKKINILTKNSKNIIRKGNLKGIKNDVYIKDLEEKPTLITNIIQYTPFNLIPNLLDGTNVEKENLLFDEWK